MVLSISACDTIKLIERGRIIIKIKAPRRRLRIENRDVRL